jgi:hypothetical protein
VIHLVDQRKGCSELLLRCVLEALCLGYLHKRDLILTSVQLNVLLKQVTTSGLAKVEALEQRKLVHGCLRCVCVCVCVCVCMCVCVCARACVSVGG